MKKLMLCIYVCFLTINTFQSQEAPTVFPASPEASNLGKYGEIPVNLSTGRINHTIPFHTVKEGEFVLPVGIAYNYAGLMVEEIPGSTGLGWNLQAHGMITRQIRGLPDEVQNGYIGVNEIGKKVFDMYNDQLSDVEKGQLIEESIAGNWDTESDKYIINIGQLSATFYFNHNGEAVFAPYKNYKLQRLQTGGFELIDDAGIKYYFELEETTEMEYLSAAEPSILIYPSAWVITRIELPDTKEITFEYQGYQTTQMTHADAWATIDPESPDYLNCTELTNLNTVTNSFSLSTIFGKLVSKINTPSEEITFDYTILDALTVGQGKNPASLDAIKIQNNVQQDIMAYFFEYNDKNLQKKLLTAIHRGRESNILEQNYYSFEYYEGIPQSIPYFKQDYWGYYSGGNNNTGSLIAEHSNRDPDFNSTRLGALKKIYYPTKGFSEFIYEQNEVFGKLDTGEIGVEERLDTPIDVVITTDSYTNTENVFETVIVPFTPNILPDGQIWVSLQYYLHSSAGYSLASVQLQKKNAVSLTNCALGSGFCNYKTDSAVAEQSPVTRSMNTTLYSLQPGEYELIVQLERVPNFAIPDNSPRAVANVLLKYYSGNEPAEPEYTNIPFGGIRIKEILSCSSEQENCITKKYSYTKEDGVTSTGINLSIPRYINKEVHHFSYGKAPEATPEMYCFVTRVSSSSAIPLSSYIGSPVLYKAVEELSVDNNEDVLKTRFHFSGDQDVVEWFPYAPTEKKNWKKGLVTKKEFFRKNGNEYVTVKKDSSFYLPFAQNDQDLEHLNSYNLKSAKNIFYYDSDKHPIIYSAESIGANGRKLYINNSELYLITFSTSLESYDNDTISQNITYTYDYPYRQLKTQTIQESNGSSLQHTYYYPYDSNDPVNGLLNDLNRITTVIETDNLKNNNDLTSQHTLYKDWGNDLILPEKIQASKDGEALEDQIIYIDYDDFGNPLEISKADGTTISYIWGYQNTKPIVGLEGISYSEIDPAAIANLQALSDNDTDALSEQTLRDGLNVLRNSHPDAVITTFTYDPLVGVTSSTDSKGYTSFYTYDDLNRLAATADTHSDSVESYNYNYAQEVLPVYAPLNVGIDYSSHTNDYQWFAANLDGGSGNFSYAWFEGVDDSSTSFEASASGTNDTYQFMVSCGQVRYVKLVVTDTTTGEIVEVVKASNNSCNYTPLNAAIGYGSDHNDFQWFISTVSGGSGNYSYAWYEGIGSSNVDFANTPLGTASSYQLFIPCTVYKYVKLVVTDTVTGLTVNAIKVSNNNPCTGNENGQQ